MSLLIKNASFKALLIAFTLTLINLVSLSAFADDKASISELSWIDQKYFERQRKTIDALVRSDYGRPIRGQLSDIALLQRVVNDESIKLTDTQMWQAMGIVLGDVFVKELKLEWKVYEDSYGRSRAICTPRSSDCLFPVTMFSRRVKGGAQPNVQAMYDKGLDLIQAALPQIPYTAPEEEL